MYDCLGHAIIIEVFSHQLTLNFTVENLGNTPSPNLLVVSANQIAENAASKAQKVYGD
jgi:hypothetical protein